MCAANDFTLSAIFELLCCPDLHVVQLTTRERLLPESDMAAAAKQQPPVLRTMHSPSKRS